MTVYIHNPTDRQVMEIINGTALVVPAKGSLATTEKKATELLKLRPELKLGGGEVRMVYSDADVAAMQKLPLAKVRALCAELMAGKRPAVAEFASGKAPEDPLAELAGKDA